MKERFAYDNSEEMMASSLIEATGATRPRAAPSRSSSALDASRLELDSSPELNELLGSERRSEVRVRRPDFEDVDSAITESIEPEECESLDLDSESEVPLALHVAVSEPVVVRRSWGELYREHASFIWKGLRRMGLGAADAEDALHEVFLVAHRRADSFDASRGTERSWLLGIALNVARAERRRQRNQAGRTAEPRGQLEAIVNGTVGQATCRAMGGSHTVTTELRGALARALAVLSPEHHAVFWMYELEGLDCAQIAGELEIPVGTVYSRLHKTRELLQKELAELRGSSGAQR